MDNLKTETSNDFVIELKDLKDAFWDSTSQQFGDLVYADVFPDLNSANEENINTENEGYVRPLTDEEQSIFNSYSETIN